MLYPFTFRPIFKDRIWGGRKLAELYGKALPPDVPVGESWEISDRPGGDVNVISNGPLAGKDLHWLLENHSVELIGKAVATGTRFPLLIKILDAREKLSLQVHPPADKAEALGGEPKTEMWHIVDADPGAELYVGIKEGVSREEFEMKLDSGMVEDCLHRIRVSAGDTMFLPSGRVHAIGAGLVIFEIQQNSDTTYRVFDWNRRGLDGKPRQLHIRESLESIDFTDYSPSLVPKRQPGGGGIHVQPLVPQARDKLFNVCECKLEGGQQWPIENGEMHIVGVISGSLNVAADGLEQPLASGSFCLIPASCGSAIVRAQGKTEFLSIRLGTRPP